MSGRNYTSYQSPLKASNQPADENPFFSSENLSDSFLDNNRNNHVISDAAIEQRETYLRKVQARNRFTAKIAWKNAEAQEIRSQIYHFFAENFAVYLPLEKSDFKKGDFLGAYSPECPLGEYHDMLSQLANYYYALAETKEIIGHFKNGIKQTLGCVYSKHKLDPVWEYRKSQIVRKHWFDYLRKTNIHREYQPVHAVFTVPHGGGVFQGNRFYARELIAFFKKIRDNKRSKFKKYFYGGQYHVEVKQSYRGNGLHIHLHVLFFQHKEYSVQEVSEWIRHAWTEETGASIRNFHYEPLYIYRKEKGQYITEDQEIAETKLIQRLDPEGNWYQDVVCDYQTVKQKKKFYLNEDSSDEEFIAGVMECLKYTFKASDLVERDSQGETIFNEKGKPVYDIELIVQILNNTVNLRFYDRFGALYKQKELDINQRLEEDQGLAEDETNNQDEVEIPKLAGIGTVINPGTGEPVKSGYEVQLAVCFTPGIRRHYPRDDIASYQIINDSEFEKSLFYCEPDLDLQDVMKLLLKKQFKKLFGGLEKVYQQKVKEEEKDWNLKRTG